MPNHIAIYLVAMATVWLMNADAVSSREQTRSLARKDKLKLLNPQAIQDYGFPRGSVRDVRSHVTIPDWLRNKKQEMRRLRRKKMGLRKRRYESRDEFLENNEGLFPMVFNLAKHAEITSNATCGETHPETFCKLVEHVEKETPRYVQCGVCDAFSDNQDQRHPVTNAIDGTHAWWQSPSITNGREYNWVTVTLDLKQIYQVAYVVVTAANSPRPGNWILERSVDGTEYKPWQYFALSDSECWNTYGIPPTVGIPRYKQDDEVICTSFYSKLNPMENGEIHTSLVNGRPGVDGPSDKLLEFTRARYIRLRLQKIHTLHADLMSFTYHDPKELDPSVTNRYFYSIKDIAVGGQCLCYGHASQCPIDPETGEMYCQCEGNTCGASCERCCPLYNQIPWRPGTYSEGFQCEMCNCFSHADSCVYNQTVADLRLSLNMDGVYKGGGVCVDCRDHTMGNNCEMCDDGYYHPPGVSQHDPDACRMCLCTGPGATGLCVKDSSMEMQGIFAGDCFCRKGFCGPRCEECAPGYRNYPLCEPCPCDPAGTIGMDFCEEQCICKEFVCGEHCDQCLPGYYNLDEANPDGCQTCFCFGLSHECQSLTWGRTQLTSLKHWVVTDLAGSGIVTPTHSISGILTVRTEDTETLNKAIYWGAPKAFVGNKLLSYGGVLKFTFAYSVNCTNDTSAYLANYDIIIEGSGMRFGHSGEYWPEDLRNVIAINMTECGWRHIDGSTSPRDTLVPKEEFMIVLADIDRLLIRASFHMYQTEAQLLELSLDVASRTGTGPPIFSVEQCSCPEGYSGTSCESCASGYHRVSDMQMSGSCEPCQCNGHSETCDPYTGQCIDCQHNTAGIYCDECAFGCHGDPFLGPDGCVPCACPLQIESNNFAETCVLTPEDPEDYKCVGCPEGYDGRYCEICDRGYYGDPMTVDSYCRPCDCNGNMNTSLLEPCDRITGECFGCTGNTYGPHCELCEEGFYSTTGKGDCKECACNPYGSLSMSCDPQTGQCLCKEHYMGRDCGICEYGFGNIALGCLKCNCDKVGSESDLCDPITGQCPCKPGVTGHHCSECQLGYFGFSELGCEDCQCNVDGSVSIQCRSTGECQCHPYVTGKYCDQCLANYWGLSSGTGCKPCMCDPVGSEVMQCDLTSGQCHCRPGVVGEQCDHCAPGYYEFTISGCKKCPVCSIPGQVCDPLTGTCACPPNTEGSQCEKCVYGTWGYDLIKGCQPCSCDEAGSISQQCDLITGMCICHHGYRGMKCNQCPFGFFDFPFCAPCSCDIRGTVKETCQNSTCTCEPDGRCQCKENVVGLKCDTCMPNSFSLDLNNMRGCTECFCFGHTKSCGQAAYHWTEMQVPDQFVSVYVSENSTVKPSLQRFIVIPSNTTSVTLHPSHLELPLYFSLPPSVHNDQTLSYNGHLVFTLTNALPAPAQKPTKKTVKPQLYIVGNYKIHLQYAGEMTADSQSNIHTVDIVLREDLWQDGSGKPVSRASFMTALQNIQHWLIKIADSVGITEEQLMQASTSGQARLGSANMQEVTLQVAVPSIRQEVNAFGIEICHCPPEYEGLSCQNPAAGYYRKRDHDFMDSSSVLDLIGISVPCQCYGHSNQCNKESGYCRDCQHNTVGKFCHECAPGYYGDPTKRTPDACKPCACPLPNPENNFSPTCKSVGTGNDYICDRCMEGYTGQKCDSCADGYYGDPLVIGGSCKPCQCNVDGAIERSCDPVSGQCYCYPGITGLKCDECLPRHIVVGSRCISCEEGCPGILFRYIDQFNEELDHFDLRAVLPFAQLQMVQESVEILEDKRAAVGNISVPSLRQINNLMEEIKINSRIIQNRVDDLIENVDLNGISAEDLWIEAEDMSGELLAIHQMTNETVQQLVDNRENRNNIINVDEAVREAEDILRDIKGRSIDMQMDNLNAGTELLLGNITKNEILDMSSKASGSLDQLKDHLSQNTDTLNEFLPLIEEIDDMVGEAQYWNDDNTRLMEDIQISLLNIKDYKNQLGETAVEAREINDKAKLLLTNESMPNYKQSTALLDVMRSKSTQVEIKTDLFEKGLPGVIPVHDKAQTHARQLQRQAQQLEDEFADTRLETEAALRAASIYGVMAENITQAQNISNEAINATQYATDLLQGYDGGEVLELVRQLLEHSKDLTDNSTLLEAQAKDLKIPLESAVESAKNCKNNMKEADEILDHIKMSQDLTKATDGNLTALNYKIITILDKTAKAADVAMDIANDLESNIETRVKQISAVNTEDISMANASVNAARNQFSQLMNLTRLLDEQKERVNQAGVQVSKNLLELKEKIRQARQLAKSIKLSLHHTGSCARRYEADLKTSMSNTVLLHFKTKEPNKDMLLFMLHNKNTSEYMVIELVSNKVRFSWDVGGGLGLITHFLPVDGSTNTEDNWYKVYAERYGSQGHLTVTPSISRYGSGQPVSGVSPPTHTMLDVDKNTPIYIGSIPPDHDVPLIVRSTTFSGCIGGVFLDGKDIGLFDFRELIGHGCGGCLIPPGIETGGALTYQFDGNGYSSRTDDIKHTREFSLTFRFRSYWKDALLFFTHNPQYREYISVELDDGFIVFKYTNHNKMKSRFKYNNNRWVKVTVQASWNLEKAALIINNNEEVIESRRLTRTHLNNPVIYFGGVPPTLNITQYGVISTGFLGCIKDMYLGPKVVNLLDGSGVVVGVHLGCNQEILNTIGFDGTGFAELPSYDMGKDASLFFSFLTYHKDGLLLLAKGVNPSSYYSVSMLNGVIHVWFNAGVGRAEITTLSQYNDGKTHGVSVIKTNRRLELYVDDVRVGYSHLPQGASRINSMRGALGGLFVGGIPEGLDAFGKAASLDNFRGCISNIGINSEPLFLGLPLDFNNADVGRCDLKRLFPEIISSDPGESNKYHSFTITITLPTSPTTTAPYLPPSTPVPRIPTSCAAHGIYDLISGAQAFGDLVNSYAEILVRKREIVKDFNMTVEVRTFYKTGMVFYITNELHDDYVAVQVNGGRVVVVYNDRKSDTQKIVTNILINDGIWHTIKLLKDFKSITIAVDDHTPLSSTITRKIDVIAPIYVGGFDPRFGVAESVVPQSFKGCMRQFNLNGNPIDLANSKRVMGVRPCFRKVERGVHFDGYSYATYAEFFEIKSALRIEFDFKTTKQYGVIISISNYRDNPALALELHQGWLKFSAVNSGGSFIAVGGQCEFCLCDNKWHKVVAEYINNAVTLTIDNGSPNVGVGGDDMSLNLRNELYIGGIPGFGNSGISQTREFFVGCLRNLKINEKLVEWHETFELENVHVAACPIGED